MGFEVVHVLAPWPGFAAALAAELPGRRCEVWKSDAAALAGLPAAECVIASALPAGSAARAGRLRLVHALGAGVDALLPEVPPAATVLRAVELAASEVCEHAWALVLALARQVALAREQQQARVWRAYAGRGLAGRTLAVLGLGAIGGRVAQVGRAFGMTVIGTRRRGRGEHGGVVEHPPAATREVLAAADVVVVALPRTPATAGLLGAGMLAAMRPEALLVVVSRGGIVDEEALVERLRAGRLAGAALDVAREEPPAADSPLWAAPNLLLTPHVAGWTADYAKRAGRAIRTNLDRLDRGLPPLGLVDRVHGY